MTLCFWCSIFAGMTYYNHPYTDKLKAKAKSAVKPFFPRSSTLMKPTASQLAKQNRPAQVNGSRWLFETLFSSFILLLDLMVMGENLKQTVIEVMFLKFLSLIPLFWGRLWIFSRLVVVNNMYSFPQFYSISQLASTHSLISALIRSPLNMTKLSQAILPHLFTNRDHLLQDKFFASLILYLL